MVCTGTCRAVSAARILYRGRDRSIRQSGVGIEILWSEREEVGILLRCRHFRRHTGGMFLKDNGLDVTLTKVEDIMELLNLNIMTTPAVTVDGEVRIKGHVPSESEIKKMLGI